MSNALAVATVTSALRIVLDQGASSSFPGLSVTTRAPDRARAGESGNQLNVFLYHLEPDAAWRNAELPKDQTGASGFFPPVALTLEYLVTAFAADDDDIQVHKLLGKAMSILHDAAVLERSLLQNALVGGDVHLQPDRVRVTPASLPLEEVSKLWTAFQSNYRLSAAYSVSVVLIESAIPRRTPLPVLKRGEQDEGVLTRVGAGPSLDRAYPDVGVPGVVVNARLGNQIVIEGAGLSVDHRIRFHHTHTDDVELTPLAGGTPSQLRVQLPDPDAVPGSRGAWAPGLYMVSDVHDDQSGNSLASNQVPLPLSPAISVSPTTHAASAGDFDLTVTCSPQLRNEQVVTLLFGESQVAPATVTSNAGTDQPSDATFVVASPAPGTYVVRLRVDGIDSLPIALPPPGAPLPTTFDTQQQVTVTP